MSTEAAPTSATRRVSAAAMHRKHQRKIQKDIEHQQQSPHHIIPFTSFSRLVHEIVAKSGNYCVRSEAIHALQEAAEDRMTEMFTDANKLALYNGRETVSTADLCYVTPSDEWENATMAMSDISTEASSEHPLPELGQ